MDSSEHRSHMHRLFQERKIITYQFGVQLEVHQLVQLKQDDAGVPMMITTLGGPAINFKVSVDAYRELLSKADLIQLVYQLRQRVYFIRQKFTRCA